MDYVSPLLQLPLEPLWGSPIGVIILYTVTIGAIGLASRSLAVGAIGGFLTFAWFARHAEIAFLETILYITLTLVIIGMGMKVWRLEGFETGG